ncbi:MAG: GAF domain-containing protein [Candidatus Thermoplasmatota archaeon]|jgi:putative methionine-R-sulfoxide reductase with GAF domain|nr:GAF domain-containing protein [Candidatus Thermoplasmatota archaeon]
MDYLVAEKKIKKIACSRNLDVLQSVVDFLYNNFELYSWVGVYILRDGMLVLGPWRGEQATEHTMIPIGKGVCGSAAMSGKTEIVPDVSADKRYLSCFVSTKSEIVVPIKRDGLVIGEIDIDSDTKNAFGEKDAVFLEKIADILSSFI